MRSTKKDIDSTEKLLNIIRGKGGRSLSNLEKPPAAVIEPRPKTSILRQRWSKILDGKKKYTVGIDIGRRHVGLVKVVKDDENHYTIVDKKIVKHDKEISPASLEFKHFLQTTILDFCGGLADCDIWAKVSTDEVHVYFFLIPRVPQKQCEKVIYWTAKKEGYLDEDKQMYDFEVQEEVVDQGTAKYAVMFYTVNKSAIERIRTMADDMGIPLAGITTVPFAMQNLFRLQKSKTLEDRFAVLFIGDQYCRIDVYQRGNLIMTRGIKAGSHSSMVEALISSVREKPGSFRLTQQEAKQILGTLVNDPQRPTDGDVAETFTRQEILEMITPAWERLARQVDLTLKTSAVENRKVEKIYLLSSMNFDTSLLDYLSGQLEVRTEFFDPFKNFSEMTRGATLSPAEKTLIAPALGFALSDNHRTPNALHTFKEKNRETALKRINKMVFLSFSVAVIACLLVLIYQGARLKELQKRQQVLRNQLAFYHPMISKEAMSQALENVLMQRDLIRQYVGKNLGSAVVGEISDLTPPHIRLLKIQLRKAGASDPAATGQKTEYDLFLDGLVLNQKDLLEKSLEQYVLTLESSPIFQKVSIQQKQVVVFNQKDVLTFVIRAVVVQS